MDIIFKILGWGLLVGGLLIIGWTLLSSYNFLAGEGDAPEIFKTAEEGIQQKESGGGTLDVQRQMEELVGEQLKGMIPSGSVTKLLNLIAWSILAFIFIFGGAQISGLGIKLIRR